MRWRLTPKSSNWPINTSTFRTQKNTKIITEDAFKYFKDNKTRYDVIYMDAFLKPSEGTDATGQPLRLKTTEFYKGLPRRAAHARRHRRDQLECL